MAQVEPEERAPEKGTVERETDPSPDQRLAREQIARARCLAGINEQYRPDVALERRDVELSRPERPPAESAVLEPAHRVDAAEAEEQLRHVALGVAGPEPDRRAAYAAETVLHLPHRPARDDALAADSFAADPPAERSEPFPAQ